MTQDILNAVADVMDSHAKLLRALAAGDHHGLPKDIQWGVPQTPGGPLKSAFDDAPCTDTYVSDVVDTVGPTSKDQGFPFDEVDPSLIYPVSQASRLGGTELYDHAGGVIWAAPNPVVDPASTVVDEPPQSLPPAAPRVKSNPVGKMAVTVGDFTFHTTGRFSGLIKTLLVKPMTLVELVSGRFAGTEGSAKQLIVCADRIVKAETGGLWTIRVVRPKGALTGKYTLICNSEMPQVDTRPSAQDTGEGGERPQEAGADSGGPLAAVRASLSQASEPVAPVATEEGVQPPADPVAAVDKVVTIRPVAQAQPVQPIVKHVPKPSHPHVEPGDLLAVDIKNGIVVTHSGTYSLGSAVKMARTLDFLKSGGLFDRDTVAKRCGWLSAEIVRQAMVNEKARLAKVGIDIYTDKFNVRLIKVQS